MKKWMLWASIGIAILMCFCVRSRALAQGQRDATVDDLPRCVLDEFAAACNASSSSLAVYINLSVSQPYGQVILDRETYGFTAHANLQKLTTPLMAVASQSRPVLFILRVPNSTDMSSVSVNKNGLLLIEQKSKGNLFCYYDNTLRTGSDTYSIAASNKTFIVKLGSTKPSNRTAHGRHKSALPIYITFDVRSREFFYQYGPSSAKVNVTGSFAIKPNDLVYFRAVNYNAAKFNVKVTYQPVAPTSTPLPSSISTFLPSLSATATAGAASATATADNTNAANPTSEDNASQLQDLLALAVNGYTANSSSPNDIEAGIASVKYNARNYLHDFILSDITANRAVAMDLEMGRTLSSLDVNSLSENGIHYIYLIAAAYAEIKRHNGNAKGAEQIYDQYVEAADVWRNIVAGTIFQSALGPYRADDTVGQMVWKVEISDTGVTNGAVSPYSLTLTKKDSRNIDIAVSSNVVVSLLKDGAYYNKMGTITVTNSNRTTQSPTNTIAASTANDVAITTGVFVHAMLFPGERQYRPALSFGLTAESTPKYLLGASLVAGHDQRLVFTVGVIAGQVKRLGDGLLVGGPTPTSSVGTSTTAIPTQSVTRSALFFSLGFKF